MSLITTCIIATVTLGIVQGNLLLPRGSIVTLTAATPVNKSAVCNIETFRKCAHQYFEHYDFKPQPISESAFQDAYEKNEVDNGVDGFKSACGWIKTFEECTVPSSCWTPSSIAQLGFNGSDASGLFYMFWNSAYLCSTGYNSVIEHFDCMWSSAHHTSHHEKLYKCVTEAMSIKDPSAELCSMIVAEVDCVYDVYRDACNEHETKMHCPDDIEPMSHHLECPSNLEHICYAKSSGIISSAFALIVALLIAQAYRAM